MEGGGGVEKGHHFRDCKQSIERSKYATVAQMGWGGKGVLSGTPIYKLPVYRYVPRNGVSFLRFSVLKQGIHFASFWNQIAM